MNSMYYENDLKISVNADKISFDKNILSFYIPDGFWVCPNNEASHLDNTVRTDKAQVDFFVTPDEHFEVYAEVFTKRRFCKTTVEYWDADKLMKAVNCGKYQLEFIYQYRTHFEQMWRCSLHYKGKFHYKECLLHIPYSQATYRWNNLREDCVW